MDQLGFDGMPQRLYPCTPSRLTAWLDCPRRYRMTYLDRPPPPKGAPWAHNSLGASVHNALAGWWRLPPAERTPVAAGALLERGWITEGFADAAQSACYRAIARQMVEAYAGGLDPADEPVGVERTVATRTDRIALSGRIDRLDERPVTGLPDSFQRDDGVGRDDRGRRDFRCETTGGTGTGGTGTGGTGTGGTGTGGTGTGGTGTGGTGTGGTGTSGTETDPTELVVVDYKTGRRVLTVDDARTSLPLALYALAAERVMRRQCHRVELHHLPTGQVLSWVHSDGTLGRHLRRATEIAAECAAADQVYRAGLAPDRYDAVFPPNPRPACGWCDYVRHCPEGRAAATPRLPWDGLATVGPVS